MENKSLCIVPWTHLNVTPQGKVRHCCVGTDYHNYAGDLSKNTLEEIYNGEYMRKLRLQMLADEKPKACSKCYETEASSGTSSRVVHNSFFNYKLKKLADITNEDGSLNKVELSYWDFRFSNLCNYKCRTCSPESSSAWTSDARTIKWLGKVKDKVESAQSQNFSVAHLEKYIDQVRKIYFSGGEPLLMDEHWQILDLLDSKKKYYVVLSYNTNLSKLTYGNKNVLDYWQKWGKWAWVWPSIDEVDERAELVRSGTNWQQVEQNLKDISKLDIVIAPNISVSCMNVFRLPTIIDRLISIGIITQKMQYRNWSLNIVEYGPQFKVSILPEHQKQAIKQDLLKYIEEYKSKYQVDILEKFLHLFWHLDRPQEIPLVHSFQYFTKKLDESRNEDTVKIIPELEEVMNSYL